MSARVIRTDFKELALMADKFSVLSDANKKSTQDIFKQVEVLRGGDWIGDGATKFYREMDDVVLPAMARLTDALLFASAIINDIAEVMQIAENDVARLMRLDEIGIENLSISNSANTNVSEIQEASMIDGVISNTASFISDLLKGVAGNAIMQTRYVFRALTPNLVRRQSTVAALVDMLAGRSGRGLPLVRFDLPHGGAEYPHINIDLAPKPPHLKIPSFILDAANKGAKVLEAAKKIALPLAITIDVFRLANAFHEDGDQVGNQTKQAAGSIAGGWAGALAGAKLGAVGGAALGGLLGSVVPILGNAAGAGIGGFLGGLLGGIAGGFGGSYLGEEIGKQI